MSGLEDSAIFPWIQMSGLYHLYDVPNATFPLYKHDLQDMFFYHNTTAKRFEIKPAEWILKGWQPVLGALTSGSYISTSPTTPFYPFRYMIDKWFQYNPTEGSYATHNANTVQPMCLSDDVQTCFGGKVVFNQNLTQVRTVLVHLFHAMLKLSGWGRVVHGSDGPAGRVGSGRVGSRFCRILAGRVGSALWIFYFFTYYFLVPELIWIFEYLIRIN